MRIELKFPTVPVPDFTTVVSTEDTVVSSATDVWIGFDGESAGAGDL
jgi:hypothetical protein